MSRACWGVLVATGCGGAGGGGGGGIDVEATADCLTYVACAQAVDSAHSEIYEHAYGADGECWAESYRVAVECHEECKEGLAANAAAFPTESACWVDGQPDARWLFASAPVWAFSNVVGGCYDATASFQGLGPGPQFSLTLVYANGFSIGTTCTLDEQLAFTCDLVTSASGKEYAFTGDFNNTFSEAVLRTDDCTHAGWPRG